MKKAISISLLLTFTILFWQKKAISQGNSSDIQHFVDSIKRVINDKNNHDTTRIAARYEYGENTLQLRVGYWDSIAKDCQAFLDKDISIAEQKVFNHFLAESYNNIGYVYMSQGASSKALKYYQKSLNAGEKFVNKEGLAATLNNMGMVYYNQGDIPKSIEYIHKALKLREDIGDKSGIAYSLNNIGYIYDVQGEPDKALIYYLKGLKIQKEIDDKRGMALGYINIGSIYHFKQNISKALQHYKKGIELYRELGDKNGEALALNNIGAVYKDNDEIDKALEHYNKSLQIRQETGNRQGVTYSLHNIGRTYFYANQLIKAQKFGDRALQVANEIGYPENIRDAALLLSEVYERQEKGMDALQMHKLYMKMKDSINNDATRKAMLKQQAKYEYEKQKTIDDAEHEKQLAVSYEQKQKQKIIIYAVAAGLILVIIFSFLIYKRLRLTKQQKQIIESQKQQVEKTNEELEREKQNIELKALKSQINPHFIFNSLNSVQKYILDGNKNLAQDYLTKFGKIMRSTLENSEEKAIPIKDELDLLQVYVDLEAKRLKNGIDFNIDIDKSIDIYNLMIPPMLLQPFIENAIKHGLSSIKDKGKIMLKMEKKENNLKCTIIDNGIGRKASALQKKQALQSQHRSMGIEITKNRLQNIWKQYNEEYEIQIKDLTDDKNNALGTSVEIILPLDF